MKFFGAAFFVMMIGIYAAFGKGYFNSSSAGRHMCPPQCTVCNASNNCFLCDTGYYGKLCERGCNHCQPGTRCTKSSGFCRDGCKDGLSGIYCDIPCDKRCEICTRDNASVCLACKNKQSCKVTCLANCRGNSCNGSYCLEGCLSGFWGESCQSECPSKCRNDGCNRESGACPEVTNDESSCRPPMTTVVVLSALLFIMTGTVIFLLRLLCRRRQSSDTSRGNGNQQTERRPIDKLQPETESKAYVQTSEQSHIDAGLQSAVGELSYITPVCTGVEPLNQYERIHSEYIPLSSTGSSENQYRQIPNEISLSMAYKEDRYVNKRH